MSDDVRYVLILQIEKITKKSPKVDGYNRNNTTPVTSEDLRQKHDVAKVAISDTDLNRLIERGGQHLALVRDEEIDMNDTKIGKPRA